MPLGLTGAMLRIWIVGSFVGFLGTILFLGSGVIQVVGIRTVVAAPFAELHRVSPVGVTLIPVLLWIASLWASRRWALVCIPAAAGACWALTCLVLASISV